MAIGAVPLTILLLTFGWSLALVFPYSIYDNALEDFITDYKVEAAATVQIANTVPQREVLVGLTQLLRPFRVLLRNLITNVTGTPAVSCLRATYNLTDVTSLPQRTFARVKVVTNVSFEIAKFYAASFINCTSTHAKTLNLERIPAVQDTVKKLVANGKLSITPCPVSYANNDTRLPLLNHTDECVTYYTRSLQKLRTLFVKAVGGADIEGEDLTIGSENILSKDLFSIPNCLFAASDDAIAAANIYSKEVATCVGSNRWTDQELSVFDYVPHIETALQTLRQYYTTKNNYIDIILSHYGNIAFLNNDLEDGTAYRNQNSLVEPVYFEKYIKSSDIASKSSNLTVKLCIFDAGRLLLQQIQSREIKLRACVDVILNETKKILNGYANILNPLRGNLSELTAILMEPANCYSANLFNSFDIEGCFTSVLNNMTKRRISLQGTNMEEFKKTLRSYIGSVTIEQYCRSSHTPPNAELQNLIRCSPLLASP